MRSARDTARRVGVALTVLFDVRALCHEQNLSYPCHLSREEAVGLVDDAGRWNVTEAVLEEHDLQGLLNCTGVSVSFRSLRIEKCNLARKHNVAGIIETQACPLWSRDPVAIELRDVDFVGNTNFGGSVGVVINKPACYRVDMQNVLFQSNRYAKSSQLSKSNNLFHLQLTGNALSGNTKGEALFHFPRLSNTIAHNLLAESNTNTLFKVKNGKLEIRDSTFLNNLGFEMGAIVGVSSNVSVLNSIFDSNSCKEKGGAVSLSNSSIGTFSSVKFVNNFASLGGALYFSDPTNVDISSCLFESNTAESGTWTIGGGGAIHIIAETDAARSFMLFNSSLQKNKAINCGGGGIFVRWWDESAITIDHSRFFQNHGGAQSGTGLGGGLLLDRTKNCTVKVFSSVFESNIGERGGALSFRAFFGQLLFRFSDFIRNQGVESSVGMVGGGIHIDAEPHDTSISFENMLFENNIANYGQGGAVHARGMKMDVNFLNSRFVKNQAVSGGAASMETKHVFIDNCTFKDNKAEDEGGALRLDLSDSVEIRKQSAFVGNAAISGGAIWSNSTIKASECSFENNSAIQGGAVHIGENNIQSILSNVSFVRNSATVGGALRVDELHMFVRIENGTRFQENTATVYGGGIYLFCKQGFSTLYLNRSSFIGNKANIGGAALMWHPVCKDCVFLGGAFFQIEFEKDSEHIRILDTVFEDNYAERAGGGIFIDKVEALTTDCNATAKDAFLARSGQRKSNFDCVAMKQNSVGQQGYGQNIATPAKTFALHVIYTEGDVDFVESAGSYSIPNWKSGDVLPTFKIVMLDHFWQAGALTKVIRDFRDSHILARFDGFAIATAESPDHLIPSSVVTNVSSGSGIIPVGGPFQVPKAYKLVFWVGENKLDKITVSVTIRKCAINEESKLGDMLCDDCGPNHFNLDPVNGTCTPCPDHCNCTAWGLAPKKNHWIPSPCYPKVMECLSDGACNYDGRENALNAFYKELQPTCEIDRSDLDRFNNLQCNKGHEGLLCGSCSANYGQFDLECFPCAETGWTVLWLLGITAWTLFATYVAVQGNLTDVQSLPPANIDSTSAAPIATSSFAAPDDSEPGVGDEAEATQETPLIAGSESEITVDETTCDIAKRNITESVKLFLNFAQVCSLALNINSRWTALTDTALRALSKVFLAKGWLKLFSILDFVGAVSVETTISMDCLFSESSSVPRSVSRIILAVLIPFVVLSIGAVCWHIRISNDFAVLKRRLVLTTVVVFYISYISWVKHLSSAFNCVSISTGIVAQRSIHYLSWTEDTSVECFKGTHAVLIGLLVVPLIVSVLIGFPVGSAIYLHLKKRNGLLETIIVKEKFGFMYAAYTDDCVFWDCIIMLRKAALALILIFGTSLRSNVQGLTAVCILVLCLYLQMQYMPYCQDYKTFNSLEIFSLLVCIFTFMAGLYFNDPSVSEVGRAIVSVLVVALIACFVIYFFHDLYWMAVAYCRLTLIRDGEAVKAQDNSFKVIMRWLHHRFKLATAQKEADAVN